MAGCLPVTPARGGMLPFEVLELGLDVGGNLVTIHEVMALPVPDCLIDGRSTIRIRRGTVGTEILGDVGAPHTPDPDLPLCDGGLGPTLAKSVLNIPRRRLEECNLPTKEAKARS